ncbi:MAG TPA: undecaprenyl-phosphate glucose phosphotransferase [Casimicrobiaceae bacterium]|jgi:putative colanic acid biosynthesis UDP-glucose lipid carrier transferase
MAGPLLKQHAPLLSMLLRALDPVVAVVAGLVCFAAYQPDAGIEIYILFLAVAALAILVVFPAFDLYTPQRGVTLAEELRALLLAWMAIGAMVAAALFATKTGAAFSRVWVVAWLAASFLSTTALRIVMRLVLRAVRRRGWNLRHIVVVGAGSLGETLAERLRAAPWAGFNIVGYFDDDAAKAGSLVAGRPVLGDSSRVGAYVQNADIDQVWIALPLRAEARIRAILTELREHSVEIRFVPDIYGFHLLNHSFTEIAGLPVISLTETPMSGTNRILKTVEDYIISAAALLVALPLLAVIAIAIRLTSAGPVLYRQERVTWNGERFWMFKFRTMPMGAEAHSGPVWSTHRERRATPLGRLLRRFSLDELPQLFNVLRGEMSLVGPRPERPEFVEQFRREIPGYMQKHLVKAGITGWAQVNDLRGDSDLSQRINYDLYYIEHWSMWFDLRILALTLWHILTSRNAH